MVCMGFLGLWGLYRLVDERVLRYGDPQQTCAIQRFCGSCWKRQPVPCGLHQIFLVALVAFAILSLIPFSSALRPIYDPIQVFDSKVELGFAVVNVFVELWIYATIGAISFLTALVIQLQGTPESSRKAEMPFFLGVGFASFAIFRFLLIGAFREDLIWSDFWEETIETISMGGIAFILYFFRAQLGLSFGKTAETVPRRRSRSECRSWSR
jgi:hypothetical protein